MTVREAVWAASEAVDALAKEVDALSSGQEPPDLEDVVLALRDVHAVMAQFRDARDTLSEVGAALMPQRQMVVAGLPVERTGGFNRKDWQHGDLMARVVRRAREEQAEYASTHDGEVAESEGQAVVRILAEVAAINYWRVGASAERGLDVDEYCRREKLRPGLRVPRE